MILTRRPFTSGANYRKIWNTETDESPLRTITREQTAALAARLAERHGDRLLVDFAMRYGNPSTASVIERLRGGGLRAHRLLPALPAVFRHHDRHRQRRGVPRADARCAGSPRIRTVPAYHDHPLYIEALARSVEEAYAGLAERPDVLVTSYHGMPERYLAEGDPYYCHCHKTTRLLRERLGPGFGEVVVTFQSRFGKEEWLKPYTVEEVARLAQAGKRRHRDHGAGLRRRLRRDAGGDPRGDPPQPSSPPAARTSPTSPA